MTIDLSKELKLELIPGTKDKEIIQNIYCIYKTFLGEVPMYRQFGIDPSYLHLPMPVAKSRLATKLSEAIEKYEPRVRLDGITFQDDSQRPWIMNITLEVTFLDK